MTTSTAVALKQSPLEAPLGQIIAPYQATLAPFLRDGITLERVAAELVLASRKTPNLDKCDPPALVDAICRALQTGGIIGQDIHIVPFWDKNRKVFDPTVMVGYKYKCALVVHAGGARNIVAHTVYANEKFAITAGTDPSIHHEPMSAKGERGEIIGAYAVAFHGHTTPPTICWLRLEEIERIRGRSKEWNPEKYPKPIPWYGEKSAVHRVVKLLPARETPALKAVRAMIATEEAAELEEEMASLPAGRPTHVDPDGVDLTLESEDEQ